MSEGRFAGRVAVVAGGASGIGEQTVRQLHAEGASVLIGDRDSERCAALQHELSENVIGVGCDVTEETEIEQLFELAVSRFGRLDAAFNAAGTGRGGPIHEMAADAWRATVDVYLNGTFLLVKHAARQMIALGNGGAIVNVASICAQLPVAEGAAYCCAKAGVEMLTRVAALELGAHRIRVNTVSPGRIATPPTTAADSIPEVRDLWIEQTPAGRIGATEDVAATMLFLAGEEAAYVSGANLVVDGAFSTTHFESVFRRLRAIEAERDR